MQQQAISILKKHQLRLTDCRKVVIAFLLDKNYAVAQPELEKSLQQFDRVTLYRTLSTFLKNGIIHQVIDGLGATKYALCSPTCSQHQHKDEHIHFTCIRCGLTKCIESVVIPTIELPKGYQLLDANFLVKGVCPNCANINQQK